MNMRQGLLSLVAFGSLGGLQGVLVSRNVKVIVRKALE